MQVRSGISAILAITALLSTAGCQSRHERAKIRSAVRGVTEVTSKSAAPTPTRAAVRVGIAPTTLRRVDWASVEISGAFCRVPHLVKFTAGNAKAVSTSFGHVQLTVLGRPVFGDLLGARDGEAALPVMCDNGGGTAAGQIASAYAIYTKRGPNLILLGTVTSQFNPRGVHITLVGDVRMRRGSLTVTEAWYRPRDGDCCPSGGANTRWTVQHGRLVPHHPVVAR